MWKREIAGSGQGVQSKQTGGLHLDKQSKEEKQPAKGAIELVRRTCLVERADSGGSGTMSAG